MASQPKEGRAVNWSYPMNPTHLPPKSPTFPGFGSSLFDQSPISFGSRVSYPNRGGGGHKRTPSAGFIPQVQPSWLDDVIEPHESTFKRGSHRRSSSDSITFLDVPGGFAKIGDHIAEEDEFDTRSVVSIPSARGSLDFDRLDEEQLMSMFTDIEPFHPNQRHSHESAEVSSRALSGGNAGPSSATDSWATDRKTPATTPENPSTPSDSNSLSEVSNEDMRAGGMGRMKSEPEVQSMAEGEYSMSHGLGDLQGMSSQIDPSLDPKRAKRILANRQSAQRSRVRKLQYISELERSVNALQTEVSNLSPQVAYLDHQRAVLNVDNNSLKQKIAALSQDKRFKEAHNEALKKEVQRLRQVFQQQQQQQHQSSVPTAYELQQQQFSKLDLGSAESKQVGADAFSGLGKSSSGLQSNGGAMGVLRNNGRQHGGKNVAPSGCMAPGSNKALDGRIMSGASMQTDFMVHNP